MATAHSIVREIDPETIFQDFSRHLFAYSGYSRVTVGNYVSGARRLTKSLGIRPAVRDVEEHIASMIESGASYSHIVNTSIVLERYCEFVGVPIKLGRPRRPHVLVRGTLSEAEVALLIGASRSLRERTMLALLAYCGLRNRELCNLRVGDVDTSSQVLRVQGCKTQKDRAVVVAAPCMALVIDYLRERGGQPCDRMFLTLRDRQPYQPQDLRKMVRAAAKRARINKRVHPHLLRHSLATNLLTRGAGLMAIKEQLGHAFMQTTMRYLHSSPARLQAEYRMFAPSYL
jgi:site-specific recombinase XerD